MKNIKKQVHAVISVLSFLWFVFVVLHIILTGKIYIWNFISSLPTIVFAAIPLVFLIYQILQKKKRLFFICVQILALVLGVTQVDLNLVKLEDTAIPAEKYREVKILNWNTNCWDQQKDREQFFRFLKSQNADIYILQEYLHGPVNLDNTAVNKSELFSLCPIIPDFIRQYMYVNDTEKLKQEFPKYYLATDNQFVVISRYPIKSSSCDPSGQFSVSDIDIYGRTVRFFNVHMLLHLNPEALLSPKEFDKRFRARKAGFEDLQAQVEKSDLDYFISGDFNSTKAMGVMGELLKKNIDAVKYSNDIIPLTFEFNGLRLWRFDYALISKESKNIHIKSYKDIDPKGLSDHNPLFVELKVKI